MNLFIVRSIIIDHSSFSAQLERDSSTIWDDGDRNRLDEKTFSSMAALTTSQMLLKKELDSLSRESGHNLGLNTFEGQNYAPIPSKHNEMQIRRIVSRVQTSFSMDPLFSNTKSDTSFSGVVSDSHPTLAPIRQMNQHAYDHNAASPKQEYASTSERTSEETTLEGCFLVERTKSPVVYYKNPDFGKRSAGRTCMDVSDVYAAPGFNINEESYDWTDKDQSTDRVYKDSTRFIFAPILSESGVSLCDDDDDDDDHQQFLINDEPTEIDFDQEPKSFASKDHWTSDGLSQIDEIHDYNLQLRLGQGLGVNSDDSGLLVRNDLTIPDSPRMSLFDHDDKEEMLETAEESLVKLEVPVKNESPEMGELVMGVHDEIASGGGDGDKIQKSTKTDTLVIATIDECQDCFPRICIAPSTSILGRIPENSWIGWPIRLYTDFATDHPTVVLLFLGAVILLTALLGKLFITMGEWFEYINDIDYNPDALMEH